jgi:hypothetical protein
MAVSSFECFRYQAVIGNEHWCRSNLAQYEAYYCGLMAEVYDLQIPICPYRLAALLSLLALGLELACVDDMVSQVAISYHELARAALCMSPTCDGVEIHLLMALVSSPLPQVSRLPDQR